MKKLILMSTDKLYIGHAIREIATSLIIPYKLNSKTALLWSDANKMMTWCIDVSYFDFIFFISVKNAGLFDMRWYLWFKTPNIP